MRLEAVPAGRCTARPQTTGAQCRQHNPHGVAPGIALPDNSRGQRECGLGAVPAGRRASRKQTTGARCRLRSPLQHCSRRSSARRWAQAAASPAARWLGSASCIRRAEASWQMLRRLVRGRRAAPQLGPALVQWRLQQHLCTSARHTSSYTQSHLRQIPSWAGAVAKAPAISYVHTCKARQHLRRKSFRRCCCGPCRAPRGNLHWTQASGRKFSRFLTRGC